MKQITSLNEIKVGYYYTAYATKPKSLTMGMCKSCTPPKGELELYSIIDSPFDEYDSGVRSRFFNLFERTGEITLFQLEPHEAMGIQDDIDDLESTDINYLDTRYTGVSGNALTGSWKSSHGTRKNLMAGK
jgi:hypothetical protein